MDGARSLTLSGSSVTLGGAIGGGTALTSLDVTGPTTLTGGAVTTTGAQTWRSPVTLGANTILTSTGGTLGLASTVDGARSLTLSGSSVSLGGALGGGTALASLDVTGATTLTGGAVTTTGAQTWRSPVTLGANTRLRSGAGGLALVSTIDSTAAGAKSVIFDAGSGAVTLAGLIGGTHPLACLGVTGASLGGSELDGGFTTLALALTGPGAGAAVNGRQGFTVGTVSVGGQTLAGVSTSGGNVSLASSGTLILASDVALQGGNLSLTAGGAITQTGGSLTANGLTGSATGAVSLTRTNSLQQLGDFSAAGFSLTNAGALAVTGGLASSGAVSLSTLSGDLILAADVAASGQVVSLAAAGSLSQTSGAVTAGQLFASAGAVLSLTGANQVPLLGSLSAGNGLAFNDAAAAGVTLGAGQSLNGGAGGVRMSSAGPVTLSGAVTATGGGITLVAGTGDLLLGGNVSAAGQSVNLSAAGAVRQSSGIVTAQTVSGASGGDFSLGSANQISELGNIVSGGATQVEDAQPGGLTLTGLISSPNGGVSLSNASGDLILAAGGVSAPGQAVSLSASGAVNQTGGTLTADQLSGSAGGMFSVTHQLSMVRTGAITAAGVQLADSRSLLVGGPVNSTGPVSLAAPSSDLTLADAVSAPGSSVTLVAGGALTEAGGSISTGRLSGSAGGLASLGGANRISQIGSFAAGNGFNLNDLSATGLQVPNGAIISGGTGAVTLTNSGGIAVDGGLDGRGGGVFIISRTGGLTLSGDLNAVGRTVQLQTAGSVSETGGTLEAGQLTGAIGGDAGLAGVNRIDTLGGLTVGGGLTLTDQSALTQPGATTLSVGAGGVRLTVGGAIELDGNIASGGGVAINGGGAITLTGQVTAATRVTIDAVGSLQVTGGTVSTPADASLISTGGDVLLTAPAADTPLLAVGRSTTVAAQTGSILIGEAPFVSAVQAFLAGAPGAQLNVSKGIPAVGAIPLEGRVFLSTGTLSLSAAGGIVQQNATRLPGQGVGIVVNNPQPVASPITLSGGMTGGPTVIDLFIQVANGGGVILKGSVVSTSNVIQLTSPRSTSYRINGCVIGQVGECTVISDAIVNVEPAKLTDVLLLSSALQPFVQDPTLVGTGNEEIWRRRK